MASRLKDLKILEVSSVDRGAGEGVRIVLMKRDDDLGSRVRAAVEAGLRKAGKPLTPMERQSSRARSGRDARMDRHDQIRQMSDAAVDAADDEDQEGTMKVQKALTDWQSEVDKVMVERKVSKSQAIDIVNRERPELFAIAKSASGDPRSNQSARPTPGADPRRLNGSGAGDAASHSAQFESAVAAIMRMRPTLTKSQAYDRAMAEPGARAHFEAAKRAGMVMNG